MSPQAIADSIAAEHGTTVQELRTRSRCTKTMIAAQRRIVAYLRSIGFSWPEAGRFVGRHHATLMANLGALPSKREPGNA